MNIIFLDFDGVLVPYNSQDKRDYWGALFDDQCVEVLRNIIFETQSKIVIISSWGNGLSLLSLKIMWKFRKMPGTIFDRIKNNSLDRSEKIDKWINNHKINNYIIIDDMGPRQFSSHHHSHIVQPDTRYGLCDREIEKAISLMKCGTLL